MGRPPKITDDDLVVAHEPFYSTQGSEAELLFRNGERAVSREDVTPPIQPHSNPASADDLLSGSIDEATQFAVVNTLIASMDQNGDRWTPAALRNARLWVAELFDDGYPDRRELESVIDDLLADIEGA